MHCLVVDWQTVSWLWDILTQCPDMHVHEEGGGALILAHGDNRRECIVKCTARKKFLQREDVKYKEREAVIIRYSQDPKRLNHLKKPHKVWLGEK